MDLFVNKKNLESLPSYFIFHFKRLFIYQAIKILKADRGDDRRTIFLRPQLNIEPFSSFREFVARALEFIIFSHSLKRTLGLWFRVKLADTPYCAFVPPQDNITHLIENNSHPDKIKLSFCRSCKYNDICGGIFKAYLNRFGEHEFKAVRDVPYQIMIEVEPRCNLNCQSCFNRNSFAQEKRTDAITIKTPLVKEIIDETARLKIPTIRFTGGEALLRPDIFELLGYAKNKNLQVLLNSNGILINEEVARRLNGITDAILISLQGIGKEGDDAAGKKGAAQGKINALFNLNRFTKAKIFLATVLDPKIMANGGKGLDEIRELIKKISSVSRWHLFRNIPKSKNDYSEDSEAYKKIVDKLLGWQLGKKNFFWHHYPFVIANGLPFCSYDMDKVDLVSYGGLFVDGFNRLSIDPSGHIKPIYYSTVNLSDDPRNILDAWQHPLLRKLRCLKYLPAACQDCFYKKKCLGGSRFLANLVHGDYGAPDPMMPIR